LDGLQEKYVAAEFRDHLMKLCVCFEQLARVYRGDVWVRLEIKVL